MVTTRVPRHPTIFLSMSTIHEMQASFLALTEKEVAVDLQKTEKIPRCRPGPPDHCLLSPKNQ